MNMFSLKASGSIQQKILLFFSVIMLSTIVIITAVTLTISRGKLMAAQESKAMIVTSNLAIACAEPMMAISYGDLMMSGEMERLNKILLGVKGTDVDVVNALLINNEGKCIASSEESIKDRFLNQTDFDKTVLKIEGISILKSPDNRDVLEAVIPVMSAGQRMGVLRIGFSSKAITAATRAIVFMSIFISILAIAVGIFVYYLFIQRTIIIPLNNVMTVAQKIADGNLSQNEIEVTSSDEIGQMAAIFNTMLRGLSELVKRAELIANGIIGSDIVEEKLKQGMSLAQATSMGDNKSQGDLGVAFDRMQTELRKITIQARRIATDDLNNPILDLQITGELGEAFSQMTSNLKALAGVAENIANSNLNVNIHIHSEKDVLANAFSRMVENLKGLVNTVTQLANTAHHSASNMAQTTKQANQTMSQVQNSIQQIASAINQVARSAQGISILVQNTNKVVDNGSSNITKVIERFGAVQNTIETTGKSISKLNERSQEISEIVGLITKIADQTNLLALNAAIEAARAGEAGRGFAVVADEVRKLAESSSSSAEKISQIIKEIQTDTENVVSSSQDSFEESKVVLGLADKMHAGYNEIVEAIKGMNQQVEQIVATSEETAASAEEITAGTQEQSAAITEIATSAQGMADHAKSLKTEISKFRV